MSRKLAREDAYKLIFEALFHKEINPKSLELLDCADYAAGELDYIKRVVCGVRDNLAALQDIAASYSAGFAAERIYKADMAALLLALYEMRYMDDIPVSVSISEAVELVKKYSAEKSGAYVNGILSAYAKTL